MTFDHYSIRLITIEDLDAYFNLINNNRKRLEDFFAGTVAITKTLPDTKIHLTDVITKNLTKDYYSFVVVDKMAGNIIASLQVKSIDWNIPKAELGYYIDEKYEGKGIVTKAISKIIEFCFKELKLNKLFIRTYDGNTASKKIAEKNNFKVEGTLRSDYKTSAGKLVDVLYYGLTLKDFETGVKPKE